MHQNSTLSFDSGGFHVKSSCILGMGNAAISEKSFSSHMQKKIRSLEW